MKRVHLLLAATFSITSFVAIGAVYAASPKFNACNPSNTGNGGDNTITCQDTKDNVDGKGGNDTITLNGNSGKNSSPIDVDGSGGNDSITNTDGSTLHGTIYGDGGDDTLTNNGKVDDGSLVGGNGNDTITNNGTIVGPGCGCAGIDGGKDNDTITNNGKVVGDVDAGAGNDSITNNGTVIGDLRAGGGNDSITNNGTVENIYGGDDVDNDTYVNNGTVKGDINAFRGSNNITNSGKVKGDINLGNCDGCDNIVVLTDDGTVNGKVKGNNADDTTGTRVLQFNLTVSDTQINAIANQIAAANPAGGSITINGKVYQWKNLTGLIALLMSARDSFNDGRINPYDRQQTITGWCRSDNSLDVWSVDQGRGLGLFDVSAADIAAALKKAVAENHHVLIQEKAGRQLWALKSNELQIHDTRPGHQYDFLFPHDRCGLKQTP